VAWTGEDSPKAARVGSSRGAEAAASYSGERRGARGRQRCVGKRATASRQHPQLGAAALGPPASLKEERGRMMLATSARAPSVSVYARARGRWQRPAGAWAALGPKGC
jgi:hypothetical protein